MIAILVLQILAGPNVHIHATTQDPGFLGFKLGMPARAALHAARKNPYALDHVKSHGGQRVLSDTVAITDCNLAFRRSLGFDDHGKLTAVGFMYKTTPERVDSARACAYRWLKHIYGTPTDERMRADTKQEVWNFGNARITLESKGYNPRDYFVLIYYYEASMEKQDE